MHILRVTVSPDLPRDAAVRITLVAGQYGVFTSRKCVHSPTLFRIEVVCRCSWSIWQLVFWQVSNKTCTTDNIAEYKNHVRHQTVLKSERGWRFQCDGSTAHKNWFTGRVLWWGERVVGHGLWQRDLQVCPYHCSFCGDFWRKEFIWMAHEALRNWNGTWQPFVSWPKR